MVEPKDLLTPTIREKLLETAEKRQKVAMDLQALRVNPGWIFVERVLSSHIEAYAQQILNNDSLTQDEEIVLKRERAFFLLFKKLPEGWVSDLIEKSIETSGQEDDPFA